MAKKKDNGEAQIESTFPPAPTLVDAPEVPEIPTGTPQQQQYHMCSTSRTVHAARGEGHRTRGLGCGDARADAPPPAADSRRVFGL